jgi:hypothetical protein
MPLFLIFALVWALLAGGALVLPERFRWSMSWALIGTGIPLLGYMTLQAGPVFGLGGLIDRGAASGAGDPRGPVAAPQGKI